MNMFKKAEKNAKKDEKKQADKPVVKTDKKLGDQLKEFAQVKKQYKSLESKYYKLRKKFLSLAKKELPSIVKEKGKKVSFYIRDPKEEYQTTIVPMDRYKKLDEDRFKELKEEYGEEVVEKKTEYKFNQDVLQKYMEHISELIENSDKISDEDKKELIEAEVSYNVKKGTLDKLGDFETPELVLEDIQPTIQVRNPSKVD